MRFLMLVNINRQYVPAIPMPSFPERFSRILFMLSVFFLLLIFSTVKVQAQEKSAAEQDAYRKVLAERTAKILKPVGIENAAEFNKVQEVIIQQYIDLNAIHDGHKAAVATIKEKALSKDETAEAVKKEEARATARLQKLHNKYIKALGRYLTKEQVDQVKDGMTYNVLQVTWTAYQNMLPALTAEQKNRIYSWLVEARELAMDQGSSEKKHQVFGKYKGKINNYLSDAGYDLKKETAEWQKRIKERNAARNDQAQE